MVAPTLTSDHPGLEVLAEVAKVLADGRGGPVEEGLTAIVGVLRRGLALRRCRLWLRSGDGSRYIPIASPDDETQLPGFTPSVPEWVAAGPHREGVAGGTLLRLPLVHDDEALGCFEVIIPQGRYERMAHDVLIVVAQMLAPVLAATALQQDLASEVALRTRELELQRNFAARIIDSLPVGLYVIDRTYRIRAWNRKREAGTQGVSREEALGREVFDVLDRQPRELLKLEYDRVFATGEIQQMETDSQATGEARHYRITKIPMHLDDTDVTHVITIGEDVTEWREAQERFAQAEKLAAIGTLAAGVMHEINNPLATIGACAETLALTISEHGISSPRLTSALPESLQLIQDEVQRCKGIVEGVLDFSRPKKLARTLLDINAVVEKTLFLLKHHSRFKKLTVQADIDRSLPPIMASEEQLVQVVMALLLNAMDAMNDRGTIVLRTRADTRRGAVIAEVVDQGEGIRGADLSKIFEPFYTTKPPGRGTGLGLSICYSLVAENAGSIEVDSVVGKGSVFRIVLPAATSQPMRAAV